MTTQLPADHLQGFETGQPGDLCLNVIGLDVEVVPRLVATVLR